MWKKKIREFWSSSSKERYESNDRLLYIYIYIYMGVYDLCLENRCTSLGRFWEEGGENGIGCLFDIVRGSRKEKLFIRWIARGFSLEEMEERLKKKKKKKKNSVCNKRVCAARNRDTEEAHTQSETRCERNAVQSIRGIRSCFSKSQRGKKFNRIKCGSSGRSTAELSQAKMRRSFERSWNTSTISRPLLYVLASLIDG